MNRSSRLASARLTLARLALAVSRIFLSVVFLFNGFGIINQAPAARVLLTHGAPAAMVPFAMMCARAVEVIGGIGLALGVFPQWSALALFAFLVPATLMGHAFWSVAGTPSFEPFLLQFLKNLGMCGGLLFIAASPAQPRLFPKRVVTPSGGSPEVWGYANRNTGAERGRAA